MIMHFRKGQSAIEYLMTYGWMLLVVAVVGGAIFSMVGEQNIESVTGFDSSNINVQDFGVGETGLSFVMNDPIGQTEVRRVRVRASDSENVSYILNQDLSEDDVVHLPGIRPSAEGEELDVEIIYDSGNLENLSTTGRIQGTLALYKEFEGREIILDGLVSYWPLSEIYESNIGGEQVRDFSRNQNHGVVENGVETRDLGIFGNAYSFDGETGGVEVSNHVFHEEITTEYSYSLWFYIDDLPTGDSEDSEWIFTISGTDFRMWLRLPHEQIYIQETTDIDGHTWGSINFEEIDLAEWNHFAITSTLSDSEGNQRTKQYLNGELMLDDERMEGIEYDISDRPSHFGNRQQYQNYFEGLLDEIRIYNRELSEEEVKSIYNEEGKIE